MVRVLRRRMAFLSLVSPKRRSPAPSTTGKTNSRSSSTIHINDLSRPVYAFWHTVLHDSKDLCRRIERAKLTVSEWRQQRKVYEERETAQLDDLGFAAMYLNRTNRSGIIDGGVIGGLDQTAKWGIDARFNADDLVVRIRRVARYASRIHLYQS